MQVKKEIAAGKLYMMNMYSAGILNRQSPMQRERRTKLTTEAKKKINAIEKKYHLMRTVSCNFIPGRDLFLYLGYDKEPTIYQIKNALRRFHRNMARYYKSKNIKYKYIIVTENHSRDGEPCRCHHHLIITGIGRRMQGKILEFWGQGSVDVRSLRELSDNFEDTCKYLLKEKKEYGKRAFSTSQNLRKPPEPIKSKVSESERGEVPPGVKVVEYIVKDNDYGRYEILIGKVIDEAAFNKYWAEISEKHKWQKDIDYWRKRYRK